MQDKIFRIILLLSALVIPIVGVGIIASLISDSSGAFEAFGFWNFLFSDDWTTKAGSESYGALPFITGTLLTTFLALIICIPFSLPVALFVGEYFRGRKIATILSTVTDLLAGIPSIVYGLFGYLLFVFYLGWGYSLLGGGMTLALMVLPTIIRGVEESLHSVPKSLREASFALGAGKAATTFKIVLPCAAPGILTSLILSIGRVLSESAVLLVTIGMVVNKNPPTPLSPGTSLALDIYYFSSYGYREEAAATAVVLLLLVLFLDGMALLVTKLLSKGKGYGK